ncbi:BBE domain-containing protein [Tateyamaria pelophila]|uniref:BBE domain-containing protein n=1 Tax=Tateyamaria pelophila TaxID=328415 RepID=UPI001CC14836|nr:BBE domain-containing protein [Tateyamaria pelophila]
MMNVHVRWQDAAEDDRFIAWAREFFDRTETHANGAVYSNFMPEDETGRAKGAFGAAYARLADIKAHHDPAGLTRTHANVVASA